MVSLPTYIVPLCRKLDLFLYRIRITLFCAGVWGVGLATPMVRVDSVPLGSDQQSWVLTSEGTTLHNGEVISRINEKPAEGDILVCAVIIVYSVSQKIMTIYTFVSVPLHS